MMTVSVQISNISPDCEKKTPQKRRAVPSSQKKSRVILAPATAIPSSRKTHSNPAAPVAKRTRSQKGHTSHEGPSKLEFPKSSHANRFGAPNRMPKICSSHLDEDWSVQMSRETGTRQGTRTRQGGSRMKRRTGSPGPWVPVAATIEYERPDLVRLKLWSKASVVPFRREVLVGLARDRHNVSKEKGGRKVCVEINLENGLWAQPSPS
jgi:hypothetical protein